MHPHAALIMSFYEAFRLRDSKGMSACYHPAVVLYDPAIGELRGDEARDSITAGFAFKDGLIARHADRFSFWRWSRQALGPVGLWLGWTPFLRARVRADARAGLQDWVRNGGQDHSRDLYGTVPDAS